MQKLFFPFLFLLNLTAFTQTPSVKINPDIQNTRTSEHINIPGTRLYIIPPPGFKNYITAPGLQKGESSHIIIMDAVGKNFYSIAADFSKKGFERKGSRVFDYQEIQVSGYAARYVFLQGDATAKGYGLAFGDSTFFTIIMAACPPADEATRKQILAALNTIYYDKSKKIAPLEAAFFSLETKNSKFKFLNQVANIYSYSPGGIAYKDAPNEPLLIVAQIPGGSGMTIQKTADMMISKTKDYGWVNPEIKNISTKKINGYEAYEAEIHGPIKGKNTVMYLCIVAEGDKVVTIQGVVQKDIQANLQEFRNLAHTIRMK